MLHFQKVQMFFTFYEKSIINDIKLCVINDIEV